jgi:hypothetical protein
MEFIQKNPENSKPDTSATVSLPASEQQQKNDSSISYANVLKKI